jgi:beta-carotene 15,15'-dioxygenase
MSENTVTKSNNTENSLLVLGVLVLIFHNFMVAIPISVQMYVLLTLVFVIGVPHGALDYLVDEQNEKMSKNIFSIRKFVLNYMMKLCAFGLFWILPWLAFSLFIVLSAYHFGETDMSVKMKPNKSSTPLYLAYGFMILGFLLLNHLTEMTALIPIIDTFLRNNAWYADAQRFRSIILVVLFMVFNLTFFWQYQQKNISTLSILQIVQFTFLMLLISFLPLLLAFTFYFALWHSLISVRNIFHYFKKINSQKTLSILGSKSILFSLLSVGSIVLLYVAAQYFIPDMNLLFALLIVLSLLTMPHLSVMHDMYRNENKITE